MEQTGIVPIEHANELSSMTPEQFETAIEAHGKKITLIKRFIHENLKKGSDYGQIYTKNQIHSQ